MYCVATFCVQSTMPLDFFISCLRAFVSQCETSVNIICYCQTLLYTGITENILTYTGSILGNGHVLG